MSEGLGDPMEDLSDLKRFKTLRALSAYVANQKRYGRKYDVDAVKAQSKLLKVEAENPANALDLRFGTLWLITKMCFSYGDPGLSMIAVRRLKSNSVSSWLVSCSFGSHVWLRCHTA